MGHQIRKEVPNCFSIPSPKRALSSIKSFSSSSPSSSPLPTSPFHSSFSSSTSTMDKYIQTAESIISKWDLNSSSITHFTPLFHHNKKDTKDFIKCILSLRRAMRSLKQSDDDRSDPANLFLCQKLMQAAIRRLEKEFHHILLSLTISQERGPDDDSVPGKVSRASVLDLKAIADCMTSSGYAKECLHVYVHARKSVVDEGLGIDQIIQRLDSESLEIAIKNWVNAVKFAVKTIFNGEKMLIDMVFPPSERTRELCFSSVVKEGAAKLFKFPEFVAKNKNMTIFPLMDMYEAMFHLWPEIESVFGDGSNSDVKQQAHSSMLCLAESVRMTLSEFESTFQNDSSKDTVPGGGIHLLTKSVMNFLSSLADYGGILSEIIVDTLPECNAKLPESYYESPTSSGSGSSSLSAVSARIAWLHAQKLKKYVISYEKMAWNRVFSSLPSKPFPEGVLSPEAAREHFFKFNAAFEKAHKKQAKWVVPNGNFRDALKVSITKKLVPVYREFHDKYGGLLSGKKSLEVLVKYGPDDVELYLSDLFHGCDSGSTDLQTHSPRMVDEEGIVETR
ncbi:Exocyst complex component EXO70H1, partial [Linum perenne]